MNISALWSLKANFFFKKYKRFVEKRLPFVQTLAQSLRTVKKMNQ